MKVRTMKGTVTLDPDKHYYSYRRVRTMSGTLEYEICILKKACSFDVLKEYRTENRALAEKLLNRLKAEGITSINMTENRTYTMTELIDEAIYVTLRNEVVYMLTDEEEKLFTEKMRSYLYSVIGDDDSFRQETYLMIMLMDGTFCCIGNDIAAEILGIDP